MKLMPSLTMSLGSGTMTAMVVNTALVEKVAVASAITARIPAYFVRRRVGPG